MSRVAVQFAVLLSVMGSVAAAQPHGRVVGQVLDQTGAVLPGVTIDLIVNEAELTTTTDDEGHYGFDAVPAGTAELTFRLLNFSVLRRIVRVNAGDIVTSDNTLTVTQGGRRRHRGRYLPQHCRCGEPDGQSRRHRRCRESGRRHCVAVGSPSAKTAW